MSGALKGPFAGLKQPPRSRTGVSSQEYGRWLDDLWRLLSSYPGISWEQIDFTNIPFDPTHNHNHSDLENVFGADDSGANDNFTDPAYVRHVSNEQATGWTDSIAAAAAAALAAQTAADAAQQTGDNSLAELAMQPSHTNQPRSDAGALLWM